MQVEIESIDIEGRGVTRVDNKVIFVANALAHEIVDIEIYKNKPNYSLANLVNIIKSSENRVIPYCPNFGICGGCSLQHLSFEAQVIAKQKVLIDNLYHIGGITSKNILKPIVGIPWQYRYRARLSVKYVKKKDKVLVGFREKNAPFVVEMSECKILPIHVSDLIVPLRELITNLSIYNHIPQIEVAVGSYITVLVFRIMEKLTSADELLIKTFVDNCSFSLQIWLQSSGVDSCYPFYPLENKKLSYNLDNIVMPYYPSEFTQVNPQVNIQMVALALKLLELNQDDKVADFFCGIGNFTLPMASKVDQVVGIEGSEQLVFRAQENAIYNKLDNKASYRIANLFKVDNLWLKNLGKFNKWLIDPPRDGAIELIKSISRSIAPELIVYVSCNSATLARDSKELVALGYMLESIGLINMFPHTSHIESIAVFKKLNLQ